MGDNKIKDAGAIGTIKTKIKTIDLTNNPLEGDLDFIFQFNSSLEILRLNNVQGFDVKKHMRQPYFVYEFNNVSDVFTWMKKDHSPLAIVLDEYGVMSGIVTLEDIIEEIVGEIDDEYDVVEVLIKKQDENTYLVDGSVDIDQVNDELNVDIESDEFESIGGLVLGLCGSARPRLHQEVTYENVTMTIEKITKNRIATLKIVVHEKEDEESEEKHD